MRTVENSLLLFLSCMLLISCTGKRSDGTIVNNEVALQTEEIRLMLLPEIQGYSATDS
mgnify:CR=1 FL=1